MPLNFCLILGEAEFNFLNQTRQDFLYLGLKKKTLENKDVEFFKLKQEIGLKM